MKKLIPVLTVAVALLLLGTDAFAQDHAAGGTSGLYGLGAGLAIGLGAIGGTYGQGNAARGAYESISRNPQAADKISTPFFVGMAFIESLVIFSMIIAYMLASK